MNRDMPDIFRIAATHEDIHLRLENWARWVTPRRQAWMHPMWAKGRSNGRQWHAPEPRPSIDQLAAAKMEAAVFHLPTKHREVIRWWYVYKTSELQMRRRFGLTTQGLIDLVSAARQMLINRGM